MQGPILPAGLSRRPFCAGPWDATTHPGWGRACQGALLSELGSDGRIGQVLMLGVGEARRLSDFP